MNLKRYNDRYEEILHAAEISTENREQLLAQLMTDLEKEYAIPMIRNTEWESNNKSLIALYRKISLSRS